MDPIRTQYYLAKNGGLPRLATLAQRRKVFFVSRRAKAENGKFYEKKAPFSHTFYFMARAGVSGFPLAADRRRGIETSVDWPGVFLTTMAPFYPIEDVQRGSTAASSTTWRNDNPGQSRGGPARDRPAGDCNTVTILGL